MRRTFIAFITGATMLALLLALELPASAQVTPCTPVPNGNGAATCTVNIHDATFIFPGAAPCATPVAGTSILTGNAVFHVTVNTADDFWETETLEASFVVVPTGSTVPVESGHATLWFGFEQNARNMVGHGTINGNGTGPGSATFGFHDDFHASTNANGELVVVFDKFSCR